MYVWQTFAIEAGALVCGVLLWIPLERRGRSGWCKTLASNTRLPTAYTDSPARAPPLVRWACLLTILSCLSSLSVVHYGLGAASALRITLPVDFNGFSGRSPSATDALPLILLPWSTWAIGISAGVLLNSYRAKWHARWTGIVHSVVSCSVLWVAAKSPFPGGYINRSTDAPLSLSFAELAFMPALQALLVALAVLALASGVAFTFCSPASRSPSG
jgi:hypothetical protein